MPIHQWCLIMSNEKPVRIIIAGSRDIDNYQLIVKNVELFLDGILPTDIEVICGEARGPDTLGRQWANERGIAVRSMPADWDGLGRSAGHIRNDAMAKVATHCIVFWDGKSNGSLGMMKLAKKYKLKRRWIVMEVE